MRSLSDDPQPLSGRTASAPADRRRRIPATEVLLAGAELGAAADRLGRTVVKQAVVAAQQRARRGEIAPEEITAVAIEALPAYATSLSAVINATGVIIHTNLGRAPLSPSAQEAIGVAAGATDVEFGLATGRRTRRGRGALAALAAAVPDAPAVHIVNNNAAALLLCALALRPEGTIAPAGPAGPGEGAGSASEIIISRGELVEIGDGFRIPDLLTGGGARLREVGTTNRCTRRDYVEAVGPRTAFILKVHPSNFVISGFTAAAGVDELATIGPPVVVDIGSGLLAPHPLLPAEPDATTALRQGADLVTASGDKLLGGPQAGLILGRADLVARLRSHPTARALRVDKLTLAALEATLTGPPPPVRVALETPLDTVRRRATMLAKLCRQSGVDAEAVPSVSVVGGGAAPGVELPSFAVSVPVGWAGRLRTGSPPVVGRAESDRLLLDLRTVAPRDDDVLVAALIIASRP